MKSFKLLLMCMLFPCVLRGQNALSQERPSWVDGYFNDLDRSYIKTATAVGFIEEEARGNAIE